MSSRYDNRSEADLRLDVVSAQADGRPLLDHLKRRVEREWATDTARVAASFEAIRRHQVRHGMAWLFGGDG